VAFQEWKRALGVFLLWEERFATSGRMYGLSNWNKSYFFMVAASIRKATRGRAKHQRVEASRTPSSMPGFCTRLDFILGGFYGMLDKKLIVEVGAGATDPTRHYVFAEL
jgi:hypothetical protein